MTLRHTESVPLGDPGNRPGEVSLTDGPLSGLGPVYYRLVAEDKDGNVSPATQTVACRAFDETSPQSPVLLISWTDLGGGNIRAKAEWDSPYGTLLQQRVGDAGTWYSVTNWESPGGHTYVDPTADRSQSYSFRVWTRNSAGAVLIGNAVSLLPES